MSKREVDIQLKRLHRQTENLSTQIYGLERHVADRLEHLKRTLSAFQELERTINEAAESYRIAAEKEAKKEMRQMMQEHKEALALLNAKKASSPSFSKGEVEKASTLAILDSIIFAISNWSTEGDTAPDFELACQSVLFPTIYERVMKGEDDYYIEEVPVSALEVVKRGREYVKMLRDTAHASLVDPNVWESYAPMVQEWWVNDALPLLYGARSEEWDEDVAFSLFQVQEWKSQPASRALNFPLLFDGMELVEKHRDQIRETTGLPEFNKQTLQTRINP